MGKKNYKNRCGLPKTLADEGFVGVEGFTGDVLPLDVKEYSGICCPERDVSGRVVSPEPEEEVYIPLHCQSPEDILCFAEDEDDPLEWLSDKPDDLVDDSDEIEGGAKLADDRNEYCDLHRYWHLIHPAVDDERPLREAITPRKFARNLKIYGNFGGTARYHDARRRHSMGVLYFTSSGRPSRKPRYKKPWRQGNYDYRIRAEQRE